VKFKQRIHPVAIFVVTHVLALGLAKVAADWVAQAYADRVSDYSSRMQLVPMPDATPPNHQQTNK
jgi:hypothetical protein